MDFDLILASELRTTPDEIRAMSNHDYLSLFAMMKLKAEREHSAAQIARSKQRRRR